MSVTQIQGCEKIEHLTFLISKYLGEHFRINWPSFSECMFETYFLTLIRFFCPDEETSVLNVVKFSFLFLILPLL